MIFPTLYARSNTGAILQWTVLVENNTYWTEAGQQGGAITTSKPQVCTGKNIGKANETLPDEQAEKEAQAAWKKKKKEGYTEDVTKIDEQVFFQPMLAKQFEDYQEKIVYPVGLEDKLNGIRSVHFKRGSFSRRGEQFYNIEHIRRDTQKAFEVFPDLVLDGELFNYKYRNLLNRIAQLVAVTRKPKDITPELRKESEEIVRLYVYDGFGFTVDGKSITQDTPFWQRKQALKKLKEAFKWEFVYILDYKFAKSIDDILDALKHSKKNGWEGIIIRIFDAPYENKRSKFLLKYKNFIDKEFEIIDILEGTGNWAGCAKKIVCKLDKPGTNGETEFTSNIRGTMEEMAQLLKDKHKYIGKYATVEFQEYSEYGVPLIPYTQLPFRDYE